MNAASHPQISSFGERVLRRAAFYTAIWFFGASLLSGLRIAFPDPAPATQPGPTRAPAQKDSQLGQPEELHDGKVPQFPLSAGPIAMREEEEAYHREERQWAAAIKPGDAPEAYEEFVATSKDASRAASAAALQRIIASKVFSGCESSVNPDARAQACTNDLLTNVLTVNGGMERFNWIVFQVRFGKALFEASARAGSASARLTAKGLVYSFGSAALRDALNAATDKEIAAYLTTKIEPDPSKAAEFFHAAAEAGDANAQIMLGAAYVTGVGTPKDNVRAKLYFSRATERAPIAYLLEKQVDLEGEREGRAAAPAVRSEQSRTIFLPN